MIWQDIGSYKNKVTRAKVKKVQIEVILAQTREQTNNSGGDQGAEFVLQQRICDIIHWKYT